MAKSALLTLSEVSRRSGISMPTLQRYKKEHQDRIPSEGEGRKQRYPLAALKAFEELKQEGLKRRGRRGKSKATQKRQAAPRALKAQSVDDGLLTLTEIAKRTGISYQTLLRYVKANVAAIPHQGEGRKRRYPIEAIGVFQALRAQSRQGGRRRAAKAKATPKRADNNAALVRRVQALEQAVLELAKLLMKPIELTIHQR